jgi:hypothetical protein
MVEWILSLIFSLILSAVIFIFAWWAINAMIDEAAKRIRRIIHGRR